MCRKKKKKTDLSNLKPERKSWYLQTCFLAVLRSYFQWSWSFTLQIGPNHLRAKEKRTWRLSEATRLGAEMSTRLGVGIRKIEKCRVTLPKTITKACPPPELIFGMSGVPVSERNEDNVTRMFWDTLHDLTPKVNLCIPRKINKNPYLYRKNL